jgi:hypothetical protein
MLMFPHYDVKNRVDLQFPFVLARTDDAPESLWLSSNDGRAMTYEAVERVISKTTLASVGIDVSPHQFRTAGASTAALHAGSNPNLGSALLHHRDPTVTAEHYNRASSLDAAQRLRRISPYRPDFPDNGQITEFWIVAHEEPGPVPIIRRRGSRDSLSLLLVIARTL